MKMVLQRCHEARVEVEGEVVGRIGQGWVMFVGVETGDGPESAEKLSRKVVGLRMFDDEAGRFALSLSQVDGGILAISNFTLCGDARKGTRPSFSEAAPPDAARALFETLVTLLRGLGARVETGQFGAAMRVLVDNDGPVTMILNG